MIDLKTDIMNSRLKIMNHPSSKPVLEFSKSMMGSNRNNVLASDVLFSKVDLSNSVRLEF